MNKYFVCDHVYGGTYSIGSEKNLYRVVYRPCGILIQKESKMFLCSAGKINSRNSLIKLLSDFNEKAEIVLHLKDYGLLEDITKGRCKDADDSLIA